MEKLFLKIEQIAKNNHGHYTLFSFTTNYKGCFGTPSGDFMESRSFLNWLPSHQTMQELLNMINNSKK